jgi:hypothetical protein
MQIWDQQCERNFNALSPVLFHNLSDSTLTPYPGFPFNDSMSFQNCIPFHIKRLLCASMIPYPLNLLIKNKHRLRHWKFRYETERAIWFSQGGKRACTFDYAYSIIFLPSPTWLNEDESNWWKLRSESLHEGFLNYSHVPARWEQELHESWLDI